MTGSGPRTFRASNTPHGRSVRVPDHPALTGNTDILRLHSCPAPDGVKVSFVLEEIGLPCEAHKVSLSDVDVKSPRFLPHEPNTKSAAILDPDGPDCALAGMFGSGA